jgi:hypothetical protein
MTTSLRDGRIEAKGFQKPAERVINAMQAIGHHDRPAARSTKERPAPTVGKRRRASGWCDDLCRGMMLPWS